MRNRLTLTLAVLAITASARAADIADTSVSLKTVTGTLWGSEITPAKSAGGPVALILAGSGPTDRNGNGPQMATDTYKLLAQALAARGIATVRTDKRGVGQSAPALASQADLRIQTYADDARAWAADLRRRTNAPCVWLVGHSEGALIAELAADGNPDVCGLVLVSGAGRKAGEVLREQFAGMPEPFKTQAFNGLAQLEAGHTIASPPPQLASLLRPSVQPYMISWLAIDPAALLAKLKVPVLILQGDTDIQVGVDDARRLAAARPDAKLVILPGVNHMLKNAPADRTANLATYGDPTLPLAAGIADTIADFMLAKRP